MIPGEMFCDDGDIEINAGRATLKVKVANTGDRPIQVGSHYHFFETNTALRFDRAATRGFRLNIAAGTAVRFEPGQEREVELVAYAGAREVYGFDGEDHGEAADDARHRPPRLRRDVRPHHGRSRAPRRHRAHHRSRARPHHLRRRSEVRRRQGDPRRHGPEPARRATTSPTPSSPTRSSSITGASSRPTSASRTAASPASARPAIPTCSRAWTSSSARAPRSSRAKGSSPPPAASTRTSTSSARSRWTTR